MSPQVGTLQVTIEADVSQAIAQLTAFKDSLNAIGRVGVTARAFTKRLAAVIDSRPENAYEFINGWVVFDVDEIDWEFTKWDPPDDRFVTRYERGLLPYPESA